MARGVMVFADGKGRHRNPAPFFLAPKEDCCDVYRLFCHWPSLPDFVPISFFSSECSLVI